MPNWLGAFFVDGAFPLENAYMCVSLAEPFEGAGDWPLYERQFLDLMRSRRIEETVCRDILDGGAFCAAKSSPIIATAALWLSTSKRNGATSKLNIFRGCRS